MQSFCISFSLPLLPKCIFKWRINASLNLHTCIYLSVAYILFIVTYDQYFILYCD